MTEPWPGGNNPPLENFIQVMAKSHYLYTTLLQLGVLLNSPIRLCHWRKFVVAAFQPLEQQYIAIYWGGKVWVTAAALSVFCVSYWRDHIDPLMLLSVPFVHAGSHAVFQFRMPDELFRFCVSIKTFPHGLSSLDFTDTAALSLYVPYVYYCFLRSNKSFHWPKQFCNVRMQIW